MKKKNYDPSPTEKIVNRTRLRDSSEVGIIQQRLQSTYIKHVKVSNEKNHER